jgi:hypothetical protein
LKLRVFAVPTGPVPVDAGFATKATPAFRRDVSAPTAPPPPEAAVGPLGQKELVLVKV